MSEQTDSDWFGYECKSGEILFYYNVKTGVHRWANNKNIFRISVSDVLPKSNELCSVGTQTEDYGCTNGCTSINVNNEIEHDNKMIDSREMNDNACAVNTTDFNVNKVISVQHTHYQESEDITSNKEIEMYEELDVHNKDYTMIDNCITTGLSRELLQSVSKNIECDDNENNNVNEQLNDDKESEMTQKPPDESNCDYISESCNSTGLSCDHQEDVPKCIDDGYDGERQFAHNKMDGKKKESGTNKSYCTLTDISDTCTTGLSSAPQQHVQKDVQDYDDERKENINSQPPSDALVINSTAKTVINNISFGSGERKRKLLQCSFCEKTFKQRNMLSIHMSRIQGDSKLESETVILDKACNNTVRSRGNKAGRPVKDKYKKKQMKSKHGLKAKNIQSTVTTDINDNTTKKKHEYTLCKKKFNRKQHLVNHLRTHTGEKPYECSYCDKAFARKGHLNDHLRTHTGEKPYECSHCYKGFAQKSTLYYHLRTHSGEKPYECSYCDKVFARKDNLNDHLRTHTGEKPYECSYCDKAFARKGNLNDHLRTHTRTSILAY